MNPLIIARAVQFASCMTLLAIPVFARWIAPPGLPTGREASILEKRLRRLMAASVLLALFSAIAVYWMVARSLTAETEAQWSTLLTSTQFGRLFLIRLALILAVGAATLCNSTGLALVSGACALDSWPGLDTRRHRRTPRCKSWLIPLISWQREFGRERCCR
ncbi:MAG: hypothetical protein WCE49_07150 [Terrimicrobiaceae bacterium]